MDHKEAKGTAQMVGILSGLLTVPPEGQACECCGKLLNEETGHVGMQRNGVLRVWCRSKDSKKCWDHMNETCRQEPDR